MANDARKVAAYAVPVRIAFSTFDPAATFLFCCSAMFSIVLSVVVTAIVTVVVIFLSFLYIRLYSHGTKKEVEQGGDEGVDSVSTHETCNRQQFENVLRSMNPSRILPLAQLLNFSTETVFEIESARREPSACLAYCLEQGHVPALEVAKAAYLLDEKLAAFEMLLFCGKVRRKDSKPLSVNREILFELMKPFYCRRQ